MTPLQMTEAICLAAATGVALLSGPPRLYLPDELGKPSTATPFVRLAIIPLAGTTMSHGPQDGRLVVRRGYVVAQCFAVGDGSGRAITLAQGVRALFEGRTLVAVGDAPTDIEFGPADIKPKGLDGYWVRADVEADFTYQETR